MNYHKPVLLQEAMHFLAVKPGGRYIDATLGGGGHASEIIRQGGYVLGLDQDPESLTACPDLDRLTKVQANFIHLGEVAIQHQWPQVDGIMIDLGVSSHQLDTPGRGFSFTREGPLDMRMNPDLGITAADIVNNWPQNQLVNLFRKFGEEPQAVAIAARIVAARPFQTTTQLAQVIGAADHSRRVFQALRIAVNDELGALESVLPQAVRLLASKGRLVVIAFHSLEDRLVKEAFRHFASQKQGVVLTPRPIQAGSGEISVNSRAKSAKLRAFIKS